MKYFLIGLMIVALSITGCTGSFNVTRNIYDLHSHRPQKLTDEIVFLGCIPLYCGGILGDAIIFNSIEFWSGRNPIRSSQLDVNNFDKKVDISSIPLKSDASYYEKDSEEKGDCRSMMGI
jgi:hypothetical protein